MERIPQNTKFLELQWNTAADSHIARKEKEKSFHQFIDHFECFLLFECKKEEYV